MTGFSAVNVKDVNYQVVLREEKFCPHELWSVSWLPGSNELFVAGHSDRILRIALDSEQIVRSDKDIVTEPLGVINVTFNRQKTLLVATFIDGFVCLFDLTISSCPLLKKLSVGFNVFSALLAFDEEFLVTSSNAGFSVLEMTSLLELPEESLVVDDIINGHSFFNFEPNLNDKCTCAAYHCSRILAVGALSGVIFLYEMKDLKNFKKHQLLKKGKSLIGGVRCMDFNCLEKAPTLAAGFSDGSILLFLIKPGSFEAATVSVLTGHSIHSVITKLMFATERSSGFVLFSSASDGLVCQWDTNSNKLVKAFNEQRGEVWDMSFSDDNQKFASVSEGSIYIYELKQNSNKTVI